MRLKVSQASFFSGFHYKVFSQGGQCLADILWPMYAQAKNARLKFHKPGSTDGNVKIRFPDFEYQISFEYLTRSYNNDIRFTFYQNENRLAEVDILFPKEKFKKHILVINYPFKGRIVRANFWTRVRYLVEREGVQMGQIHEPSWFSVKRTLAVDLSDDLSPQLKSFFAFMVINSAFR